MIAPYYVSTVIQQERERAIRASHFARLAGRVRDCCRASRVSWLVPLVRGQRSRPEGATR
jgi:hypothetical protein